MLDLLKKTLLTGMGLGLLTLDRVEEMAREVAKTANLSAEKGQELVDEAVARARQSREDLETRIKKVVRDTLKETGVATREEVAQLAARVELLERSQHTHNP